MGSSIENAWLSYQQGDFEAAMAACIPEDVQAIFDAPPSLLRAKLAAIFLRAGFIPDGLATLAVDWTLATPDAAGLAGALIFSLGNFDLALAPLKHAVNGETKDPGAHLVNLGRNLTLLGQPTEAIPYLKQGIEKVNHGQTLAIMSLADALVALNQVDEALELLPASSDDDEMIRARVSVLAISSRHEEASQFLREAIKRLPDETGLLIMASDLAEVRGRSGEAIALLEKAAQQDPDNIHLWVQLARAGRKGSKNKAGHEAAEKAMALAEDKPPQLRALAMSAKAHVLLEAGEEADAEALYRDALLLAPGLPPLLSGLGHLLLQRGQVDEAMGYFEQLRATAPLQGWSQLIHARKVPDDPEVLEHMEASARQPSLEGPIRASMLFTVAAAWDKKKEHERAMMLAREANDASKLLLPYQPAEHRAQAERIMSRFSQRFMASREGWGSSSRLPVFVLGMPRSGTTLTEQILGSHSQVFGAGELGFISEQIQKLLAWERKVGSRLKYPECVADMTKEESQQYAAILLEKLQAFDPAASHVIDKLPHNFEHVGLIKLLFPNATIFHCRREPRDIAISNYITDYAAKFGGMGFAYDLGWIGQQLVDHDRLLKHWHAVFPGQIMEVVYEDLVEDTEGWARQMIQHLGLEWEPGVLEFQDLERSVKTASVWQVRQPVYKTSKERWRKYEKHLGPLEEALSDIPAMPSPMPVSDLPPGLFGHAMHLLKLGRFAEAERTFIRIIKEYPKHAAAHQFLGAARLQQGKIKQACTSMTKSVRLLRFHPTWFENLARARYAAGDLKLAEAAKKRADKMRAKQKERMQDDPEKLPEG